MAKHGKNKRFGGDNFERVRKNRSTGQDALDRDRKRKNNNHVRPMALTEDEYFYDYESDKFFSENN